MRGALIPMHMDDKPHLTEIHQQKAGWVCFYHLNKFLFSNGSLWSPGTIKIVKKDSSFEPVEFGKRDLTTSLMMVCCQCMSSLM